MRGFGSLTSNFLPAAGMYVPANILLRIAASLAGACSLNSKYPADLRLPLAARNHAACKLSWFAMRSIRLRCFFGMFAENWGGTGFRAVVTRRPPHPGVYSPRQVDEADLLWFPSRVDPRTRGRRGVVKGCHCGPGTQCCCSSSSLCCSSSPSATRRCRHRSSCRFPHPPFAQFLPCIQAPSIFPTSAKWTAATSCWRVVIIFRPGWARKRKCARSVASPASAA